jgi:hypothetical protein
MNHMVDLAKVAGEYQVRNPKRYVPMVPPRTLPEAVRFCESYWIRNFPDSVQTYLRHIREFVDWAHEHLNHELKRVDRFDQAGMGGWKTVRKKAAVYCLVAVSNSNSISITATRYIHPCLRRTYVMSIDQTWFG